MAKSLGIFNDRRIMGKILFIDVDGTLVTYENKLPESAAKAVKKARSNGHRVYICTGRSRAEIGDELWNIGLNGMIGGNGSYVESDGQVIMHQLITKQQCTDIVNFLQNRNLEFYLESNNGLFASENFAEGAKENVLSYMGRKGKDISNLTVADVFPDLTYGGELYRDDVNKISYALKSYEDFRAVSEQFDYMQNGTWGGAGETALFGDLGVKDITKAHAIDTLLDYLGQTKADTIAFGDAKVDIPMLEYCGYGVAMGSGGDEIKAMADFVTDDVDKDGLYKAFEKLGLI